MAGSPIRLWKEGRAVALPVRTLRASVVRQQRGKSPPPDESSSLTAPPLRSRPSGDHSSGSSGAAPNSRKRSFRLGAEDSYRFFLDVWPKGNRLVRRNAFRQS